MSRFVRVINMALKSTKMLFIEVKLQKAREKDMVSWSTGKTECMKASGQTTTEKEKEWKDTQMAISMRVISIEVKLEEGEFITGLMEKSTMVSGKPESKKGTECGEVYLVTLILDNGRIVKQMGMVFISGRMEIGSRDLGSIA